MEIYAHYNQFYSFLTQGLMSYNMAISNITDFIFFGSIASLHAWERLGGTIIFK